MNTEKMFIGLKLSKKKLLEDFTWQVMYICRKDSNSSHPFFMKVISPALTHTISFDSCTLSSYF